MKGESDLPEISQKIKGNGLFPCNACKSVPQMTPRKINSGIRSHKPDTRFFRLWQRIMQRLSPADRAKKAAAQRWIAAVNHLTGFGRWYLRECKSPYALPKILENAKRLLLMNVLKM